MELYSLQGLAEHLECNYDYLRKVARQFQKGKFESWRGFKFVSAGNGRRSVWLAYPEDQEVTIR